MSDKRILIVEDEGIIAAQLKNMLGRLGYEVLGPVASGEEALQEITINTPDLVLMDICLAGNLDGIETTVWIRDRFDIPVLYLTAFSDDTLLHQAQITNPFGYLLKSVQDKELHAAIEMSLYRHKLETKLKKNERWLDTTLRSIGDAVIATDEKGCITFMNPVAEKLTGWDLEEALGKELVNVFHIVNEDTKEPAENPVERVIREGAVVGLANHTVMIKKDGTHIPIDNNAAPIRDEKGNICGVVLVFRDITERKKTQEAFKASEERFRIVVDNINFGVTLMNTDMEIISMNKQMRRWYPDVESTKHPICFLALKRGETVCKKCPVCETFKDGQAHDGILDLQEGNKLRQFRVLSSPVKDNKEKVIAAIELLEDITVRKQLENERKKLLYELGERLKELECLYSLSKLLEQHDISLEELFMKVIDLIPPAFQSAHYVCARIIFEGKEFKTKNFQSTKHRLSLDIKVNGKKVGVLEVFYLEKRPKENQRIFLKEERDLLGVICERLGNEIEYKLAVKALKEAKDELEIRVKERTCELRAANEELRLEIAERKKVEQEREKIRYQLFHTQKMEAIGTLAGGVAHDFSNMLTVIQGNVDILLMQIDESDPIYKCLQEIRFATSRSSDLIRQLLVFSRKGPMEYAPFNLNHNVSNLSKILNRVIGEDIKLLMRLDPDLWGVEGDYRNIEQVIMNLVVNARDAMPKGGELVIKTQNITVDKQYCHSVPEARPGRFVCLSIVDSGVGIDKEVGQHIFEPFFTTKEVGKGTGIGLPVVYGIVKQHEGWITLESEPGRGSTFNVFFPARSIVLGDEAVEWRSEKESTGKGERILLVEDEGIVRKFIAYALIMNGYEVFEARNAQTAKEIFNREKGDFHLVFSDVVLPDTRGDKLVEEFLHINPKLRAMLGSGYTGQKVQWKHIKKKGVTFIQKPYSLDKLFQTVKRVLMEDKK